MVTKRLDINLGKKCNQRCQFCYYYSCLDKNNLEYEKIIERLRKYREKGIKKLHITGGEPTIHKDISRIIRTCKKMGFTHVSVITNGMMLGSDNLIQDLKNSGIDEFAFSVHGYNAKLHDSLTGVNGSFEKQLKGISNAKKFHIHYIVNLVVNKLNYNSLDKFAESMIKIKPRLVTFLYFNPMDDAITSIKEIAVQYNSTIPYLKKAINILEKEGVKVDFKFIPLCMVDEYNADNANFSQAIIDDEEWNYKVRYQLDEGYIKYLKSLIKNFRYFEKKQLKKIPFEVLSYITSLKELHHQHFIKSKKCKKCKYDLVCDGIFKRYAESFGTDEFTPIIGERIIDPVILRRKKDYNISNKDIFLNFVLYYLSKILFGRKKKKNEKEFNCNTCR